MDELNSPLNKGDDEGIEIVDLNSPLKETKKSSKKKTIPIDVEKEKAAVLDFFNNKPIVQVMK